MRRPGLSRPGLSRRVVGTPLLMMAVAAAAAAAETISGIEQPRPFGHFLGDVLTQRVPLGSDSGNDPPLLPVQDRVGSWFDRRNSRIESSTDGRRWLVIEYQIVNAPAAPADLPLPAFNLTMKNGEVKRIDAWRISVAPMTTPASAKGRDAAHGDAVQLQPDRLIASLPTAELRHGLTLWCTFLAALLVLWISWFLWRNRRDAVRLPFARAWTALRRHGEDEQAEENWIAMHRALNATAGRVLRTDTLDRLFEEHPMLKPVRPDLQEFYRQSSLRFFSMQGTRSTFSLVDLCRQLRRIEKRNRTDA